MMVRIWYQWVLRSGNGRYSVIRWHRCTLDLP